MSSMPEVNEDGSKPYVQSLGPALLLPAEAIGNVVTRTNNLILEHRNFLANLPSRIERPSAHQVVHNLITPPPSLNPRAAFPQNPGQGQGQGPPFPECSGFVASASNDAAVIASSAFARSLASVSSTANATIASLQSSITSIQSSANQAVSTANANASAQSQSARQASISASQAIASATASANAAIQAAMASAQSSANIAIAAAQSSASSSVLSANNALSSIQSSANAAVGSASQAANDARATATFAIQQAQASASAVNQQASANIRASREAAMNTTKFALAITFAVLGSSIITILIIYFIVRYRRKKREAKQLALKEKIRFRPNSESPAPSLSEFPMPANRTAWTLRGRSSETERQTWASRNGNENRSTRSTEAVIPVPPTRQTWAPSQNQRLRETTRESMEFPLTGSSDSRAKTWSPRDESRTVTANGMDEYGSPRRPTIVRKNTLTYDPEHPERPPKFTTWLEESFRSVSPFPVIGAVNSGQPRVEAARQSTLRRKSVADMSGIGTAI